VRYSVGGRVERWIGRWAMDCCWFGLMRWGLIPRAITALALLVLGAHHFLFVGLNAISV
jgi:hypothetical protein